MRITVIAGNAVDQITCNQTISQDGKSLSRASNLLDLSKPLFHIKDLQVVLQVKGGHAWKGGILEFEVDFLLYTYQIVEKFKIFG